MDTTDVSSRSVAIEDSSNVLCWREGGDFTTYIFRNKLWTEILTLLLVGLHSIGLCICPFYFYDWHMFLYRSVAHAFQCWPFQLTFPLKTLAHDAELICYFLHEIYLFCFWVMGTLSILHNYCAIFSLSLHNYFFPCTILFCLTRGTNANVQDRRLLVYVDNIF